MKSTFVSFADKVIKHQEGDVWEESGKTWTIKNGLKRTITKMDEARKSILVPLACPECGRSMKHPFSEKTWVTHKMCFECVIDHDHELMKRGEWNDYEKKVITENTKALIEAFESYMDDYMQESIENANVTEDGLVEKWKNVDKSHLENIKKEVVDKLSDNLKQIKNDE